MSSQADHPATVSYNRDAAVQYAEKYGGQFTNDDGKYYNSTSDPEDCTHFVSRALLQGGINDTSINPPYGINNVNTLAQWLVANNLASRPIVENSSSSGGLPVPPSALQAGDIILYAWHGLNGGDPLGNQAWNHAAIVVSGNGGSSVVAEHSFADGGAWNEVNEPWSDWNITKKTTYGFLLINTPTDDAKFVSQSQYPTVNTNRSFQLFFTLQNTGTSTWSDSSGYILANMSMPMGAGNAGFNGQSVAPGNQWTFTLNMTAPSSSGKYNTIWRLMHNNTPFGPGLNIFVTVQQSSTPVPPVPGTTPTPLPTPTSTPTPVPTQQGQFIRSPVVARNADGRMVAFAVGSDNQLYTKQEDDNGNWSSWASLGGSWPGQPAIGLNTNGVMEIFIVGNQGPNGGTLFHAWQTSPGSASWTGWQPMDGLWPAGTPAVTNYPGGGGLQVFMRGVNTDLYTTWENTPGDSTSYSSWTPMGGYWNTDPVVAKNADGTMEVFMVGESKELYYNQENIQGGWSGWQSLKGSWPGQPAVILNSQGELEVFIVGGQGPNEGTLFYAWQTSPESATWAFIAPGSWYSVPGNWPAGNPAVMSNPGSNLLDVFSPQNNGTLSHDWQTTSGWSGPQPLGGSLTGQPAVSINLGNGIEVFMLGTDGQIYHCWETTSGNSSQFSNWVVL